MMEVLIMLELCTAAASSCRWQPIALPQPARLQPPAILGASQDGLVTMTFTFAQHWRIICASDNLVDSLYLTYMSTKRIHLPLCANHWSAMLCRRRAGR